MSVQSMTAFITANLAIIVPGLLFLLVLLGAWQLNTYLTLSHLRQRYRQMMNGNEGLNLEDMLIKVVEETNRLNDKTVDLDKELRRQNAILEQAVTKVGVVRFCAFEDIGSDLSYAVALLDAHHNGIVISSIFGRDESRTYAKPIVGGKSEYALTEEENRALKDAMSR